MIFQHSAEQIAALQKFDTCRVSDAIETFDVRLRNEGFADNSIRCLTARERPLVGHAATLRIRCSSPPMVGHVYVDRTDWWSHILTIPAPRIVVIQDLDETPGTGSFIDEVHAQILLALGCVGCVTNGAVRDLSALEKIGFRACATTIAVSHAYEHIVDFGGAVEVSGLVVNPGDLLHGDQNGVVSVPHELVAQIPEAAARLVERDKRIVELCGSPGFSMEKLRAAVKDLLK